MSLWHRAILMVVGTAAIAVEEIQKQAQRVADEMRSQMDENAALKDGRTISHRPSHA